MHEPDMSGEVVVLGYPSRYRINLVPNDWNNEIIVGNRSCFDHLLLNFIRRFYDYK